MPVLPREGSLGAEQVRVMEVFALIVNGRYTASTPLIECELWHRVA